MANNSAAPRSGLSLYANLLDPSKNTAGSTISSAPVTYTQPQKSSEDEENAKKQAALAASLRFQPTQRPRPQQKSTLDAQKAKAKAIAAKLSGLPQLNKEESKPESTIPQDKDVPGPVTQQQTESLDAAALPFKSTVSDWQSTALDDDETNYYAATVRKEEQNNRKKRKKNKNQQQRQAVEINWDDIYDPSRPNNYEEYKGSDEKIAEVREWKDLLYRHRMKKSRSESQNRSSDEMDADQPRNKQFAPPPAMSFAPPTLNSTPPPPPHDNEASEEDYVSPPAVSVPNDLSGDDVYARRVAMNQSLQNIPPPPPEQSQSERPEPPAGSIMRAPVRYDIKPPQPADPLPPQDDTDFDLPSPNQPSDSQSAPRTNRPGQAGFAERLLAKYGWSAGQGLGLSGTGITSALYAKADKRKKKSDAEGGGFVTPATTGRILGGQKSKAGQAEEQGKFGAMSEVIRLEGMLKGLDVRAEMGREGGGLVQEIGEECAEKYGNVERVYICQEFEDDSDSGPLVFVQFTAQLSALRAVNALEGRVFNGNVIIARFWDKEKFERREYI